MSVLPNRAVLPEGGLSAGHSALDHSLLDSSGAGSVCVPGGLPACGAVGGRVAGTPEELAKAARGIRVALLGAAVVVMSLVDLYITLLYLDAVGLAEENPLARAVMSQGSPGLLAGWKIVTLLPALLVFFVYRSRASVEALAWAACVVLALVTLRWGQYADETDLLMASMPAFEQGADHRWVTVTD